MKQKLVSLLLVLILIISRTYAEEAPKAMEQIASDPITVRVLLTNLNVTNRLDIALEGDYSGNSDQTSFLMKKDSNWTFLVQDDTLYVYGEQINLALKSPLTLKRLGSSSDGWVCKTNNGLYRGDLTLLIKGGQLLPILQIELETYMEGVLPYEMSNSFPLEALKAQAVAARTYAIQSINPKHDYDMTDNPSSQVFKAGSVDYPRCRQAIAETKGVCGYYKNKPAQCYYGASNGGQTELVTAVWETQEDFSYYQSKNDPYDLENPESPSRSYTLQKKYPHGAPAELNQLAARNLQSWLRKNGYDPSAEGIQIIEITACSLCEPLKKSTAVQTVLQITARIRVRTMQESKTTADGNTAAAVLYGPLTLLEKPVELRIPIFPEAESAFMMDINHGSDNEVWSVEETEDRFMLRAKRYGHGVGMSQRGAEWMAKAYQKTYLDILAFYYPGLSLKQFVYRPSRTIQEKNAFYLQSTPGPAATPTPRPTAVALESTPKPGEQLARVTEIDELSSLNLRSEPSLSGEILARLYRNQVLILEEYCKQEGWVKVRTDTLEGYVKLEFLTVEIE